MKGITIKEEILAEKFILSPKYIVELSINQEIINKIKYLSKKELLKICFLLNKNLA